MKTIFYLGNDHGFFRALCGYAGGNLPESQVLHFVPESPNVVSQIFRQMPAVIFIDTEMADTLHWTMVKLKQVEETRSIFWVLIAKNEEEIRGKEHLLSAGIHLVHLQELEHDSLFTEAFALAFSIKPKKNRFARARGLEIPMTASLPSVVRSVTDSGLFLETDLDTEGALDVPYSFLNHDSTISSKIRRKHHLSSCPYLYGYEVEFPFPGPWDETGPDSLLPDMVLTWLSLHSVNFAARDRFLAVFTRNSKFYEDIIGKDQNEKFWHYFLPDAESSTKAFPERKPELVLYDLVTDKGLDLERLEIVINNLRSEDGDGPEPLIIAFNSRSDSEALKKIYNYRMILAVPTGLSFELFSTFQEKLVEKFRDKELETKYFQVTDPTRLVCVPVPVHLSSLTENDITFYCSFEIPCYSVMKSELPIPLYLTIVPAEDLHRSTKGNHYRALIHGVSEENKARLRKIVNQLIFHPIKEITSDIVANMLKQDYHQKEAPPEDEAKERPEQTTEVAMAEANPTKTSGSLVLRPKGRKSKL